MTVSTPCSAMAESIYSAWKEALQKRMLLEKVIAQDVNAKIQVTDEEAERYFKANRKAYAIGEAGARRADRRPRPGPGGGDPEKIEGGRGF